MAVHLKALLQRTQVLHPNEVEDQTCAVCLHDYLQDSSRELPRRLPCGHLIGTECLFLWASSHPNATSIDCPWCRRPIIHSINARYLRTAISAYAEAALQQVVVHLGRAFGAVGRGFTDSGWSWVSLAIVVLSGRYFNSSFAWLPSWFLYLCLSVAVERCVRGRRRLGAVLVLIGYCLGTFYHPDLGRELIRRGKGPFGGAIGRAYSDYTWLVLGSALGVCLVHVVWQHPATLMIADQALDEFIGCALNLGLRLGLQMGL